MVAQRFVISKRKTDFAYLVCFKPSLEMGDLAVKKVSIILLMYPTFEGGLIGKTRIKLELLYISLTS